MTKAVNLSPRLKAALELVPDCGCVADIGCDHGRLSAALIQSGKAQRVIAVDISAPSLAKARRLVETLGLEAQIELREGDGLRALLPEECDAVLMLGMGGTLTARLLEVSPIPFAGAKTIVMQPMRGVSDLRLWLYEHGCGIVAERVVKDAGRLYQVFAAALTTAPLPEQADCFELGCVPNTPDTLYLELLNRLIAQSGGRLKAALGSDGEAYLGERLAALMKLKTRYTERVEETV